MSNYAVIENTLVVNITVADPAYAQQQGWVLKPETPNVGIGWSYIDNEWIAPIIKETPQPETEEILKSIVNSAQNRLDEFAKTRGYDGILSLATYATSTVPKFQAEGQYGVEARDATWAKLYEIMAEVEAGTRPMPAGFEDIEPELPLLEWPN